jgi:hypothetical protein
MNLIDYPKPKNLSKRGMHWSASCYPEEGHWQDNLAWCADMGIGFIKFVEDGGGSGINVYRECWKRDMIPVVRLYIGTPGQCGPREADAIKRIADTLGFRTYFELCNEPDLPIEWGNNRPTDWLMRSINAYCDYAPKVWGAGGLPGTFALASGAITQRRIDEQGNVLDPVGINFIKIIVDRLGGPARAQAIGMWLSDHNYTINHPPDYPSDAVNQEGQPLTMEEYRAVPAWAWDNRTITVINAQRAKDQNPGATIWTDDTCFRGFEIFLAHAKEAGIEVPLLTTEGGPTQTRGDDGRYAKVTEDIMLAWLPEMYRVIGATPEYFAHCHWLLYNTTNGWEADRWRWGSQNYDRVMNLFKTTPVGAWGEAFSAPTPEPIPEPGGGLVPVNTVPDLTWIIPTWNDALTAPVAGECWHLIRAELDANNTMDHTLYVLCLDNNGERIDAGQVRVKNANGQAFLLPPKTPPDWQNQPIGKNDDWECWIDSGVSEHVAHLNTQYDSNDPAIGGHTYHYTYRLTFQYGVRGIVTPPPVDPPVTPGDTWTAQDDADVAELRAMLDRADTLTVAFMQRHS